MNLMFSASAGCIIICFRHTEINDASILLRALLNEKKSEGGCDENFGDNLFVNLNTDEEQPLILFSFKYFGIAIRFLEVVLVKTADDGRKIERIGHFLEHVEEWYSRAHAVQ